MERYHDCHTYKTCSVKTLPKQSTAESRFIYIGYAIGDFNELRQLSQFLRRISYRGN